MAADRCFQNLFPDNDVAAQADAVAPQSRIRRSLASLLREPAPNLAEKFLSAALVVKEEIVQKTWIVSRSRIKHFDMYTGVLGTAFLCFRAYQTTGNGDDLKLSAEIVEQCAGAAKSKSCQTFLCGQSGIYALGAVVANYREDKEGLNYYLARLNEAASQRSFAAGLAQEGYGVPCELLYGHAGFLWAVVFLEKQLGYEVVSSDVMAPILDAVLAEGRAGSHESSSPLMYKWHGKCYLGAAHGLAGIIHCLLHFSLKDEDTETVKGVLQYIIRSRFHESGNYPSSIGSKNDRLVHWCHGAPGIALTLCKAAEVFPAEADFRKAALEAGEVVWQRGLLRRVGICHGISGNAYTFLALHQLIGDAEQLYRAKAFACFLLDQARNLISHGDMHAGDHPYSLFEGLAGMACLYLDMVHPMNAKFPGYEI